MPSSGGQRSRELFSPAANRAEQAQTLATQETKWKESQRRHSTQAANVRMEPGKPDSGPIGLNAIALGVPLAASGQQMIQRQPRLLEAFGQRRGGIPTYQQRADAQQRRRPQQLVATTPDPLAGSHQIAQQIGHTRRQRVRIYWWFVSRTRVCQLDATTAGFWIATSRPPCQVD